MLHHCCRLDDDHRRNRDASCAYTLYKSHKLTVVAAGEEDLPAKFGVNVLTYSNTDLAASLIYIVAVLQLNAVVVDVSLQPVEPPLDRVRLLRELPLYIQQLRLDALVLGVTREPSARPLLPNYIRLISRTDIRLCKQRVGLLDEDTLVYAKANCVMLIKIPLKCKVLLLRELRE
jgi:hypothetical protein